MKSAKVFLTILVIISMLTVFGACGNDQSSKPKPTTESTATTVPTTTPEPTSAISSLNEDEYQVYYSMKNTNWNDPSSARVLSVKKGKISATNEDEIFYIEISAANQLGGNTNSYYKMGAYGLEETTNSWASLANTVQNVSVSKINSAWKEYCEQQGW